MLKATPIAKHRTWLQRAVRLVIVGLSFGLLHHAQANETHWVTGSWVALHAQPAADMSPLLHVHTNQAVELLSEDGEWCEVLVIEIGKQGYLQCENLGEAKLTVETVAIHSFDYQTPNPDYSPSKAFWIEPSVPRLIHAGDQYETTELSEEQILIESGYHDDSAKSLEQGLIAQRPTIPEFEAMKVVLTDGIIAGESSRPRIHHWPTLQAKAQEVTDDRRGFSHDGIYAYGTSVTTMQDAILRPVTPSYFDSPQQLAPAHSGVEALSANFGITAKIRITGGPQWVWPRHEMPMVVGSWDVGAFDHYLTSPVIEHVIGRQGLVGAKEWQASFPRDLGEEADEYCDSGLHLGQRASESLPDYPTVKDPVIWFYTATPLPFKKAKITTHAQRFSGAGASLIVAHEVDIDDDGVADVAAIEQLGHERMDWSPDTATNVGLRMFFANIGGEWYLIDIDEFTECT